MVSVSRIRLVFMRTSKSCSRVKAGLELTSISHGLQFSSKIISNPNISNAFGYVTHIETETYFE